MNLKQPVWTGKQRTALILQLIQGRVRLPDVCLQYRLDAAEVGHWIDVFVTGGARSLNDLGPIR